MAEPRVQFTVYRGDAESARGEPPRRTVQELWLRLSREPWSSLVLVPADEGTSAGPLANELADAGGRLRAAPVTAIVADSLDFESARMLADLQSHLHPAGIAAPPADAAAAAPATGGELGISGAGDRVPPAAQVVVAVQPVVTEPLGVAIAQPADVVLMCFELRKTRLEAVRRTLELLGEGRVAGALVV